MRATRYIAKIIGTTMLALAFSAVGACVEPMPGPNSKAIPIGALLPFTGDIAASGTNIERAIRMALERVNDAGGIAGDKVRLAAQDTHSELSRGLDSARELIREQEVQVILGPENEDLAFQIIQNFKTNKVVQISGGVTSPVFSYADDDGFFFRTSPSAHAYGQVLVERMVNDGIRSATVLYVGDGFGSGFASVLINEFNRQGIEASIPISFQLGEASYADSLRQLLPRDLDAIVLVGYPKSCATIVQEWALLGGTSRWYLSPPLKATDFIDNVPPGLLNGVIGVAPILSDQAQEFATSFADRFDGDIPLDAAAFYYDAAALALLAMAQAAHDSGAAPTGEQIRDVLQDISRPQGQFVRWNELDLALDLIGRGEAINFEGVSGSVDLDERGDLSQGQVGFWTIDNDHIQDL